MEKEDKNDQLRIPNETFPQNYVYLLGLFPACNTIHWTLQRLNCMYWNIDIIHYYKLVWTLCQKYVIMHDSQDIAYFHTCVQSIFCYTQKWRHM